MSAKSNSIRIRHGKRRALVKGAFGNTSTRNGGKARFGYQAIKNVCIDN